MDAWLGFAWPGSLRTRETAGCWRSQKAEDDGPLLPRSDGGPPPEEEARRCGGRPLLLEELLAAGRVGPIRRVLAAGGRYSTGADRCLLPAAAAATPGRAALIWVYTYSQHAASES
jgi:hypothetical protein